ncbi:MAG: helix-turn-helix transcriptional regulator [Clostridiales bacterium]|nr:helix-turn-helix transcriptional regulator [Clostridiales bacterium]
MKDNIFGKKLKELRMEKGISQQKLGEELGFCNQTISFWENGSREPDLDTLVEISRFFGVSIEDLLVDN